MVAGGVGRDDGGYGTGCGGGRLRRQRGTEAENGRQSGRGYVPEAACVGCEETHNNNSTCRILLWSGCRNSGGS